MLLGIMEIGSLAVSPPYYQTYNPDGMFPIIDVIETGFQEHIDIELYYRLKDL